MEQELNQGGAVQEVTSEVTPPDEKATSEKVRTEKEFTKMQSMKDKAAAEADTYKQHLQSVQGEVQRLQYQMEQQGLEAQRKELEALADDPDKQELARRRQAMEKRERENNNALAFDREVFDKKVARASEYVKEYSLSSSDFTELMTAELPREMELMAKLKGKEPVATQPPKGIFPPDSGTSDAAPSNFKQLEKDFISDPWKYGKEYKEALAKRGQ